MNRPTITVIGIVIVALAGSLLWIKFGPSKPAVGPNWETCTTRTNNVSFDCPQGLAVDTGELSADAVAKTSVIFRATEGTLAPPLNLNLRVETGLRIVISLTKLEVIQMLLGNSEKALPGRFPEYKKLSKRTLDLNGRKAAEIYFTYQGPAGEIVKQRFLIVAQDDNTAYYFAMQSKEADFATANAAYFDRITSSFTIH